MTHEFKTPLATIALATSAIEKEKVLNDRAQLLKFNAMIRSENERMDKYVERILLQAKLDRREVHLKKSPVNLNSLVSDAVQHFRLQVESAGGEMRQELDKEGMVAWVDEVHLFNVVCNLIDNAIKYSPDEVNIFVYTRARDGEFAIGVQDRGIGIPKEAQAKVFKRFYRVPSGNVHNVKGFGLGLSYVKSIVLLHGGDIRLTSRRGKGTLVEIVFKLDKEEQL
jgi:two-component system phosphate regulon sensor histidine kinase PhoR